MGKQWMDKIMKEYPGRWKPPDSAKKNKAYRMLATLKGCVNRLESDVFHGSTTLVMDWEEAVQTLDELFELLDMIQLREDNKVRDEAVKKLVKRAGA